MSARLKNAQLHAFNHTILIDIDNSLIDNSGTFIYTDREDSTVFNHIRGYVEENINHWFRMQRCDYPLWVGLKVNADTFYEIVDFIKKVGDPKIYIIPF